MDGALKFAGLAAVLAAFASGFWLLVRQLDTAVATNSAMLSAEDIHGAWEVIADEDRSAIRGGLVFGTDSVVCVAGKSEAPGGIDAGLKYDEWVYSVSGGKLHGRGFPESSPLSLDADGILTLGKERVEHHALAPLRLGRAVGFRTCDELKASLPKATGSRPD
jgi:hypothetical protein